MKKILFLFIALLISLNVGATIYYIDPAGNDGTGDGSSGNPWQTLSYAASQVAEGDHTIYVNAGTYPVDSDQAYIRVGVKIDGAGATSYLKTDYNPGGSYSGWIHFYSATLTNGNQSVKNVKIGGESLAGNCAINIINRSNIEIYNVEIFDFAARGINIRHDGGAVTYITGIEIHECNIHNCSDRTVTTSCGLIVNKGADGTDIHDNTLTQTSRAEGHNGNIYTSWGGYEKNTKFYRNVCTKPDHDGVQSGEAGWNFHWESGACYGGIEIYENTFVGGVAVDIAGGETGNHYAGASTYSYYIHHNTHSLTTQLTYSAGIQRAIFVDLEGLSEDVIVEYNYIDKVTELIACNTTRAGSYITRFKFRYNIGTNLGYTPSVTSPWRCGVQLSASNSTGYVTNCEIDNNIIIGNGIIAGVGLSASTGATIENIKIRNNIVQGVVSWGWLVFRNTGGAYEDIYPWNNIIYDCVTDDTPYYEGGVSVTNYDPQNNIVSNPLFVGTGTPPLNYKLQSTSPGRDAGYAVGLISDYGGYSVPIGSAPDIGAWEYGADVDPPDWTEQGIGWDRMQKKVNFRDSVNFTRGFMIAGVPISASGSGLEILGGLTATVNDLNNTSGSTGNLQGQINAIKTSTVDDSKADTSLSNLASVAINTHLLPDTAGTINLGSGAKPFGKIFGTATQISSLMVGDSTSNTIAKFDSVAVFNGKLYAFIAGDTVGWGILTADSEDITDHVIMLTDTAHTNGKHILYTQWQVDSIFAGFTSGFDSVYIYAKVDSLINVVGEQQSQIDLLWAAIDSLNLGDFNPPSFLSAEVGTFNDSILVVILNDTDIQQDSIPAVGAFTVKENGVAMGIEEIDIGNDTVYISLDALAIEGYTYKVSYNKDFDYPQLQDSSENITPSWTDRTVTNNVFDAFPSIVSVTETLTNSTDRTSHPITMPASVDEGDLLLVFFAADGTNDTDPVTIDEANSDDGWTLLNPSVESGSAVTCVFWKIADSDGDTLTVITNDAQISVAQTYRITGFESTDPVDFVGSNIPTLTQYPDPPAATGTYGADDYLWIVVCGGDGWTSYATSAPTDFTGLDVTYIEVGGACSVNTAYRMYNIGTEYNPGTFTSNATDEAFHTFTIIVNPIQ